MFDILKFNKEDFIFTNKPFINSKLTYVCDIKDNSVSIEMKFMIKKY